MNATNEQIVALYESGDISVEQLQEMMPEFELESLKLILANGSKKYRKQIKKDPGLFNDDDRVLARTIIKNIAETAYDNPGVQLKAAKMMYEESLGRNDNKGIRSVNFNFQIINDQIKAAKEAIEFGRSKVIDIPEEHKHLAAINE